MDLETLSRGAGEGLLERPRVAVDAMGGDHAPEEVVRGATDWARTHDDVEVILVGDEERIRRYIEEPLPAHVTIVQASESVSMEEQPALAVRRKRDASINVCMRLVKEGLADAVVTAGHTGAGVASAILNLKRLPGVDRPALAVQMVTDSGPLTLLDIGATTDSTGLNLAQYAHMGSLFSERVLGVRDPRVALLSIGEEAGKGERRVREATALLQDSKLRFIGNIEGRDIPHHPADVVVCDATVGNVVMKFFEGISEVMFGLLRREFKRPPWGPMGYLFMRPGITRLRGRFDYERLGGAPLLGVNGTVLITHGGAKRRMIGHAVEVTAMAARARIPERITATLVSEGADKPTASKRGSSLQGDPASEG
ncbi:MAG: phosphate acyltransferase PlsX [Chloroflexota bacterium]